MSLINELLSNLEGRHDSDKQQAGVISGLQAADEELARGAETRGPRRLVVLLWVLAVPALAGYMAWQALSPDMLDSLQVQEDASVAVESEAGGSPEEESNLPPKPDRGIAQLPDTIEPSATRDVARDQAPVPVIAPLPVAAAAPEASANVTEPGAMARLEDMRLIAADNSLNMELQLSAMPEFKYELLEKPDRLVFDFEATGMALDEQRFPGHDWIRAIRHNTDGRTLRLVFELDRPLQMAEKQWLNSGGDQLLTVKLSPVPQPASEAPRIPAGDAVAVSDEQGAESTVSPRPGTEPPAGAVVDTAEQGMSVTARTSERTRIDTSAYQQARRYFQRQNYQRAIETLEMHLADVPNDPKSIQLYTLALIETNQVERAEKHLRDATGRLPQATELKLLYAQLLQQQNKTGTAVAVLRDAPPPITEAPAYHAMLAALLQDIGEHGESARIYERLLQITPQQSVWWMGLAIALEKNGRRDDALAAYEQALQTGRLSADLRRYVAARMERLSGTEKS